MSSPSSLADHCLPKIEITKYNQKKMVQNALQFCIVPIWIFEFPRHLSYLTLDRKKRKDNHVPFSNCWIIHHRFVLFFFLFPACFFIQNKIIYALYFCKVVRLCRKCIDMWNRFATYVIINRMSDQSVTWLKLSSRYCGSTKRKVASS